MSAADAATAGRAHNLCEAKGHACCKELLKLAVRKNNYRRIRSVAVVAAAQEQRVNEKRAQQVQRSERRHY